MPKWNAVGFGAKNADVDPESIGSIYDEASVGVPPRGVYRFVLKRLQATETGPNSNNPGTPMMKMVCEILEPKGTKKAKYNGYGIWFYRTVEEENANRVNQFLMSLMAGTKLTAAKKKTVLKAFWEGNVVTETVGANDFITKIGTWTLPKDGIEVAANTQPDSYNSEKRLAISSLIPITDAPAPVPADEDDVDEEDLEDEESDEFEEEDEETEDEEAEEDEEEADEEDDPAAAREEELAGYDRKNLVAAAKVHKLKTVKVSDDDLIAAILDIEFPEDEEEPEDDEEELEEDEAEEDEAEEDDEEEDEEEEPEPPAKPAARRTRAAAKPAAKAAPAARKAPTGRAKSTAAASSRPAARRRKGSGEPPF